MRDCLAIDYSRCMNAHQNLACSRFSPLGTLLVTCLALIPLAAAAQRQALERDGSLRVLAAEEQPHLVGVQLGVGFLTLVNNGEINGELAVNRDTTTFRANAHGSPSFGVTYDYRLSPLVSIGGGVHRQQNRFDNFRTANGELIEGASIRANRTMLSARALLHYGNQARFEMYSGARVGLTIWTFKVKNSGNDEFDAFDLPVPSVGGVLPLVQVIPFGFRAELSPGLSLGGELALGSPHFAALQVGYRF